MSNRRQFLRNASIAGIVASITAPVRAKFPPVYSIIDLYEDGNSEHRLVHYDSKV